MIVYYLAFLNLFIQSPKWLFEKLFYLGLFPHGDTPSFGRICHITEAEAAPSPQQQFEL